MFFLMLNGFFVFVRLEGNGFFLLGKTQDHGFS